jgi:drug/metabolite transporter (DMT)-like permease
MTVGARNITTALLIDVAATLVFVLIGRGSHNEDPTLTGLLVTWWPFLAALAVGWVGTVAWRRPLGTVWPGIGVWVVTVAGGMLFRALSGQGTALAFVIVATLSLGVLLIGWRAIAAVIRRRSRTRTPSA